MREIKLNPINDVLKDLYDHFKNYQLEDEWISILDAENRVVSSKVFSNMVIPPYRKSTVDGYAIKTSKVPQVLKLVEAVQIESPSESIIDHNCIYVPTGGKVPDGADLIVKIEETKNINGLIHFKAYPNTENIINIGEDMNIGDVVLNIGQRITIFDIGALANLGILMIQVKALPKISILSTGNELVSYDTELNYGQTYDINGITLRNLAKKFGFQVLETVIVKDDYNSMYQKIKSANAVSDLVLVSGGSSMGFTDYTFPILNELGEIISDGMALKPGKPTIISKCNNKPIVGLPGHPVSAIMVFNILMTSLAPIFQLNYYKENTIECILERNVKPAPGRDTYQMVSIDHEKRTCTPTSGKSGMITLLTKSDGYIIIPKESDIIISGTKVICYLF